MKKFSAEIKKHELIDGAYIEIPFDVEKEYNSKRVKVKAKFEGEEYRGSIVKMGGCYLIGIPQNIRRAIGKSFGEIIAVEIELDEAPRVIELPDDFKNALEADELALKNYESLSFSHKREYYQWIESAKKSETRAARIEKSIRMLAENKKLK